MFVVTAFLCPTDTVISVIGAQGYVASLVSMGLFAAWLATAVLGFHDVLHTRHPVRGALALVWISSLLSYVVMPGYSPDDLQRQSADRWLMLLAGMSGVVLVASEHLRTPRDILRVTRILVWGAAVSAAVAVVQFTVLWDLKQYLRIVLVGFDSGYVYAAFQSRDALVRVIGTSNHPIELGVIAGMLLPVAIWLGFYDTERSPVRRWTPVALIGMCVPMSVSRSAILVLGVSVGLFLVLLPARRRAWLLAFAPVGLVAVFATTPGYLRTIAGFFTGWQSDPSIANRVDNYPRVLALVREAPWFGRGGGTALPENAVQILDNQYLKASIELGLVGVLALVLFFVVPALAALNARARAGDERFRALCAALAGACLGAALGSYTFDSLSFSQFASVLAVVVGLAGACWLNLGRWPRTSGSR